MFSFSELPSLHHHVETLALTTEPWGLYNSSTMTAHLRCQGRSRGFKNRPQLRPVLLPAGEVIAFVFFLQAEAFVQFSVCTVLCVHIRSVENLEGVLRVPVCGVGHPAAWLNLKGA